MNRKAIGFILATVFFSFTFGGCRNSPIIPESPVISFSTDVQPIIAANCQLSGCHGSQNGGAGRTQPLVTYSDIINNGGVEPFNAHNSVLYERITNAGGYNLMPPSPYNRLSQQQLLNIYLWIMQGANNN